MKRLPVRMAVWRLALAAVLGVLLALEAQAETLVLAGSGSNLSATRILIREFRGRHPEIDFAEPTNVGSSGAVRAAADGAISLGLISRPLRGDERELRLTVVPFARTALVIGAHPGVPDPGLTSADLLAIYRGNRTAWGNGRRIVVLTREPGDSTIEALEEKIPGFRDAYQQSIRANRWAIIMKDEIMNRRLQQTPDALGFSDVGAITSQHLNIKILRLNGVFPSPENVANGSYPLTKTLAFTYRQEKATRAVEAFIAFARSVTAQKILRRHGYIGF